MLQQVVRRGLFLAALIIGPNSIAFAQTLESPSSVTPASPTVDVHDEARDEWRFTLGGGFGIAPDYEGSEDYKVVPIPAAIAKKGNYRVRVGGVYVESNVLDHPNWRLGPSANFRSGYSKVKNNKVDDLNNRGNAFELGLKGGYQHYFGKSSLGGYVNFLHDVTDGHEGYVISPSIEYETPLAPDWKFFVQQNITYASGDYMSHYFSVNQRDSADTGLDTFDADADFKDWTTSISFIHSLTQSWHVTLIGSYKLLLGDAADSPVVDDEGDRNNFFGGFTVTYSW